MLRLSGWRDVCGLLGAWTVIAGSASGFAEPFKVAGDASPAASGVDCVWADSVCGSIGISITPSTNLGKPPNTPQTHYI
jgi:hypothetical protein